jgi:hypothetical protein
MGSTPAKYFLPSAPYGASPAANALNPTQPAATNPQTPLLPPNFQSGGNVASGTTPSGAPNPTAAGTGNPFSPAGANNPYGQNPMNSSSNPMLKALFGMALLLLLSVPAWATTTVTGSLQNLGTGTVGQAAFVRFWLRGCGGNIPRVNGTAVIAPSNGGVYYFDMIANSSGAITGTLYSTRDSTGLLAGDIECGGSKLSVFYGMQVYVGGKGGAEIPVHAKNGVTLDITQVVPISQTPPVTAPTGDSTYCRLDGANGFCKAVVAVNFTTAGATTSDVLTVTGMTAAGHCILSTSNALAATGQAAGTTWLDTPGANVITLHHTNTNGQIFTVFCTPN